MRILIKRWATPLFFIFMCINIFAGITENETLKLISKPLLLPLLMALVLASTPASKSRTLMLIALFFSFAGDVFLLFESKKPILFIPGLASFLLTHILYIFYFLSIKPVSKSLLSKAPYLGVFVIIYGIIFLYILFPFLGVLKIPVIIYACIIMSMLLTSIHIYYRTPASTAKLFIAGAVFFVLSDSLLAFNKFHTALSFPFVIMLTYCIAQFLIVKGYIRQANATS